MKTPCQLPVTLTKTEQRWGFAYLVLALLILPLALTELNALLPSPFTDSWLNILYFSLNFIFTGYIFRGFLRRSLAQAGKHVGLTDVNYISRIFKRYYGMTVTEYKRSNQLLDKENDYV